MRIASVVVVGFYVAAGIYALVHFRAIWEALRYETEDFGPTAWFVTILLSPIILGLVVFVLILPLAFTQGWVFRDSRPDGCYRQTTQWSPATKTNQVRYLPVPCPEDRIVP